MPNPFYITATEVKLESGETGIFHKYVDENGDRKSEIVNFQPDFYVASKEGTAVFKSMIGGEKLKRVRCATIQDYNAKRRKIGKHTKIHGDFHPNYQFLSRRYPGEVKFDYTKFRTVWVDIETDYDPRYKPDPPSAKFPVQSIAAFDSLSGETFCWFYKEAIPPDRHISDKNVQLVHCESEEELLERFLDFWKGYMYPDFAIGWNSDFFDFPYLYYRTQKLFGDEVAEEYSPLRHVVETEVEDAYGRKNTRVTFEGINNIDMMQYYKKFVLEPRPSYKLETIAQIEVKSGKYDYSSVAANLRELYEKSFDTYIEYNVQDVHIMDEINQQISLMDLVCTLSYYSKINPRDCISPVRSWEAFTYNYLMRKRKILPGSKSEEAKKYGYLGGFVKKPNPGLYEWIVSFDVNSMYPHLIRAYNMGPETLWDSEFVNVDALDVADFSIYVDPDAFRPNKYADYTNMYTALHGTLVNKADEADYVITSKSRLGEWNGNYEVFTPTKFASSKKIFKSGSKKDVLKDIINPDPQDVPDNVSEKWARTINGFYFNTENESVFSEMIGVIYSERTDARAFKALSTYVHKMIDEKIIPEGEFGTKSISVHTFETKIRRDLDSMGKVAAFTQYAEMFPSFLKRLNKSTLEEISAHLKVVSNTKDIYQHSMKIFINSLYGALANIHFRLNDIRIASSITSSGRECIRLVGNETSRRICDRFNTKFGTNIETVLAYTDTDSIYLSLGDLIPHLFPNGVPSQMEVAKKLDILSEKVINPIIEDILRELEEKRNMIPGHMVLKREVIGVSGLWMAKKKYAILAISNEDEWYPDPKMKPTGIDVIKPSMPEYVRTNMKIAMEHILKGEREQFVELNMNVRKAFRKGGYESSESGWVDLSYQDLGFSMPVNKLEEWTKEIEANRGELPKGCPGQVYAAYVFNKWIMDDDLADKYKLIEDGDKVYKFQLMPNSGYGTHSRLIDYIVWPMYGEIPVEFGMDRYMNFSHQYDKLDRALIEEMSVIVNWPFGYGHYDPTGTRTRTRKDVAKRRSAKSVNVKSKVKKYKPKEL